ncbi:MAG: serine protease, partial [Herminiimonas sp.]|nr:serine protease [Herminiimonas sp.]
MRSAVRGIVCAVFCTAPLAAASAADLTQTVVTVKPSVVAIATQMKTRSPAIAFFGTGFAVGDGSTVLTNAHVL